MAIVDSGPLNLEEILINYFSGTFEIFFFMIMIAFSYLAAKFKMNNSVYLMLMGLFVILMAGYGYQAIYTLVIFIIGIIVYWIISKMIKS